MRNSSREGSFSKKQQKEHYLSWELSCYLMPQYLPLLMRRALRGVGLGALEVVQGHALVLVLEDANLPVLVHVKAHVQVVGMSALGHAKTVALGHANIRVVSSFNRLQDSI